MPDETTQNAELRNKEMGNTEKEMKRHRKRNEKLQENEMRSFN